MRHLPLAILIGWLLVSSATQASDWPQWGGTACRNMVSEEKNLPDSFVPGERGTQGEGILMATTKNVKWAVKLGDFACAAPAVAGGKVFIGGLIKKDGILSCFDETTGQLLWRWTKPRRQDIDGFPEPYTFHWAADELGVSSTPVVDGDRLYFVDQNANVVCLDVNGLPPQPGAKVGEAREIWTFDMLKEANVEAHPSDAANGSPIIDGDFIYVPTSNGVDRLPSKPQDVDTARRCAAPNAPSLIVLDKRTGRLLARDDAPIVANMLHGQWSSPSIGVVRKRKLVFFGGGDGTCYAFNALTKMPKEPVKLETVWWVDCIPAEYRPEAGQDPIEHYILGDRRRLNNLNKKNDGTYVGTSEIIATPVFYKDRIYAAIGRDPEHGRGCGALICADATRTGEITQTGILWTYKGLDRSLSNVSIADGLLYIADVAGRLHCLDAETGAVQWIYETKSRMIASTMVADGKVYMQTERHLHILSAGKEMKLLSKISLGGTSWITPVVANGTVYVGSRSYLWALKP